LDLLLAVVIWLVSVAIFLYINTDTFLKWADDETSLVSVVAIVPLATTIATSIWLYTYLLGNVLSRYLRGFIKFLLRGTTSPIDPYEHTLKVIGIVGSIAMLIFGTVAYLAFVGVV
jgi:hypothetical protein